MYLLSFQDNGCAAVATAKPASGAVSQGKLAVLHLDCRMSFAAQLPNLARLALWFVVALGLAWLAVARLEPEARR